MFYSVPSSLVPLSTATLWVFGGSWVRYHVFLNLVGTCSPVVFWRVNLSSLHALNMGKNEEKNLSVGSGVQPQSLKFWKVLSTQQYIFFFFLAFSDGLPRWLRSKNLPANAGKVGLIRVGRISWRRKWPPTPVFLSGESHGQRSLVGYSPWGLRVRHN